VADVKRCDTMSSGGGGGFLQTHKTEDAVLRLKSDSHSCGDEITRKHRHSNTKVHVHPVCELAGGASHDALAAGCRSPRLCECAMRVMWGVGGG
jgi:hypothetical protein